MSPCAVEAETAGSQTSPCTRRAESDYRKAATPLAGGGWNKQGKLFVLGTDRHIVPEPSQVYRDPNGFSQVISPVPTPRLSLKAAFWKTAPTVGMADRVPSKERGGVGTSHCQVQLTDCSVARSSDDFPQHSLVSHLLVNLPPHLRPLLPIG